MPARKGRRSDGTGSIFQDKYGYWNAQIQVGYTDAGRPRFKRKRAKNEAEVVAWLKAQTVKAAQGINLAPEKLTVKEFLERWLAECERANRYTTHKSYAQICHDHVCPRIGRVLMIKLTKAHVQAIIDTLHDKGKARNTIRNVRACLVAATADVEREYPQAYAAVRLTKLPKIKKVVAPVIRALTPEQARILLAAVEPHRLKALYWVTLLLGLREGEVLGLRIEDLDLGKQTLQITGAMQRQTGKGMVRVPTKTAASEALLPVPDVLIPILHEHLAMLEEERLYDKWREHGLLFPSEVGTPISSRNVVRHFKQVLGANDLPNVRFHDLRHSCATLLISLSVHPRIVMEILRHTQISTTMNIYGHAIPEVSRDAVNALGNLVMPERLELPMKRVERETGD
jgi:integrase